MAPIFTFFLEKKHFLILYTAGILVYSVNVYHNYVLGELKLASVDLLILAIIALVGLYVFFACRGLYNGFKKIFSDISQESKLVEKGKRVQNLFLKKKSFESYTEKVSNWLNSKNERYFTLGSTAILYVLLFVQDHFIGRGLFSFSDPLLLFRYVYVFVWSAIVGVCLFSVIWLIITLLRALFQLQKESPQLHITHFLINLERDIESQQANIENQRIGMVDLSFRRFQAGLHMIVNFVLNSSLKLAFVGVIASVPAIIYFLITNEVLLVWYGIYIFTVSISLIVFIFGQYGIWKLWNQSKDKANQLLHQICANRTQEFSNLSNSFEDATLLCSVISDLDSLKTVTYSSSSVFKLASVNFLTFGPLIIEQLIISAILH